MVNSNTGNALTTVLQLRGKLFSGTEANNFQGQVVEEPLVQYAPFDKLSIIRGGLPFDALDVLGRQSNMPIRQVLELFDIPQTTYNKKKREQGLLGSRDSELVLAIASLLDFGYDVFNQDEVKFHRWLKKPNLSLAGRTPESLFDTFTGVQQVKNALDRLEYGILA
jgi:putative toxin-antitoxin system antitoxin component (TIGR02293 family)